jgi:hypothetical protein
MRFIIYFVNLTFNLVKKFRVKNFTILTKFEQSLPYIRTIPKILSRFKKPTKNYNNQTQQILTFYNHKKP